MNKLIPTKSRIFISLVGPSILAKLTWFMNGWKSENFNPNLTKLIFSINTLNHSMMSRKKKFIILSLFKVYTLNLSTLWKITVSSICSFLMTHVQKLSTPRIFWTLLPLADIGLTEDLFDRTVDAKGMKTKDSKETVKTFSNMITKKE